MATKIYKSISRYSDEELALFKILIQQKLEKAENDLAFLREQIEDTQENTDDDGDFFEDSSKHTELEMLHTMHNRQYKHIQDLKHALIRIHNKNYGICMITGELIDKARLMAVPTTSKCVAAKIEIQQPKKKAAAPVLANRPPRIISKILRRTKTPDPNAPANHKEDAIDGDFFDDDNFNLEEE